MTRRLVLASRSPARRRLLTDAGVPFEVIVSGADETIDDRLDPAAATLELAHRKADAVIAALAVSDDPPLVLACDSMLAFDGATHGKPGTPERARAAWRTRRGRPGSLWTGHVLVDTGNGRTADAACATTVWFAEVTDAEIDAYVASGEPLDVAGAFTLDGR
ncbi:MAG: septum formation protein Maf, partial [Actinobacteria bacterium]|nr:septum formation protein Maf [Actinomycetota bacterium]